MRSTGGKAGFQQWGYIPLGTPTSEVNCLDGLILSRLGWFIAWMTLFILNDLALFRQRQALKNTTTVLFCKRQITMSLNSYKQLYYPCKMATFRHFLSPSDWEAKRVWIDGNLSLETEFSRKMKLLGWLASLDFLVSHRHLWHELVERNFHDHPQGQSPEWGLTP